MLRPTVLLFDLALVIVLGALGTLGAWLLRRRTTLTVKNLYLVAALAGLALAASLAVRAWSAVLVLAPIAAPALAGAVSGRRWRLADLGAGEELRQHELSRRWMWQPALDRRPGERRYIASQGEIVHERPWPHDVEYVPMTAQGDRGARLPLGEGQHVFECGGTGTGKTTTARRLLAARTLAHGAAALLIDQKGDPEDEEQLRRIAAAAGRPFVLFDPRDPDTDRWQPLWGEPADVAARAVEPIKKSEPYYADVLRQHLNLIVEVLHAADRWPPSFPLLVDGARSNRYETICDLAAGLGNEHRLLKRRVEEHAEWVSSRDGKKDLAGGLVRLELVMGAAWRRVLTPRLTPDGDTVAVGLVEAIKAGAVVMWRTYADDMPDEAAAITVLALSDLHAAAGRAGAPWTLMLDEFGAVIHMAAARGIAILQRARSHHGQVIVITQSAADIEALSQQPGLLPSLSDNFSAFVAHRQTAPETRDWLAKLMGTRAIWQSTDQTPGHTGMPTGSGSRRRVREFRIGSDVFATQAEAKRSSTPRSAPTQSARPSCPSAYPPTTPTGSGTATGTHPRSPCTPRKRSRSPCTTPSQPSARPTSTRTTSSQVSSRSPRRTSRVDGGSAGRSAVREYERRRAQREARARARLGPLGQALARLIGDPQSTRAWKQGADEEIRVARQLARHLSGHHVVLLHDRRIPGRGRANIDHIAIGPGGITVIDTKSARGRLRIETRGGFLSPRRELLLINGRDRTDLVDGLERQLAVVRTVVAELDAGALDVRSALCFPNCHD